MSPIAFVEMPAYGHINPTLRLLCELAWRGEHVVYYDVGEFQARVERAGATFGAYAAGVWTSTDICRSQVSGWLLRAAEVGGQQRWLRRLAACQ